MWLYSNIINITGFYTQLDKGEDIKATNYTQFWCVSAGIEAYIQSEVIRSRENPNTLNTLLGD
jgi:hypothetical protein